MSSDAWKKENTIQYTFRLMKTSQIPGALDEMIEKTGRSRGSYIVEALREKLIRDGYLSEEPQKTK